MGNEYEGFGAAGSAAPSAAQARSISVLKGGGRRVKNEALQLEKFMNRSGPVMELCIEENVDLW